MTGFFTLPAYIFGFQSIKKVTAQGNRVKKIILILLMAVSTMVLSLSQSHAADQYYLEIGTEATQTQAAKNWQNLSSKYKSQLKGLTYYPKTVLRDGASAGTLIQAGPVASKEQAQKICSKLF